MKDRDKGLTSTEKEQLQAVAQKQRPPEMDEAFNGPIMISEQTYLTVYDHLFNSLEESPYYVALQDATEYFEWFSGPKSKLANNISSWLNRYNQLNDIGNLIPISKDNASIGIGLVINAFSVQYGPEFMDGLKEANPQVVMREFDLAAANMPANASAMDRAQSKYKIPEDQIYLRRLVGDMMHNCALPQVVQDGANVMYGVVEKLWPQIWPPKPQDVAQ